MKLFLTYYRFDGGILDIYNGFSFGCHNIKDADHMFITDNVDLSSLKTGLKKYSTIYYSASLAYQYTLVKKILDKRWILGGPYIDILNNNEVTLYEKLDFKDDDIFIPYWNKWLSESRRNIPFNNVRYSANCKTSCYWNKCKYCGGRYSKNKIDRNILKVLKQLPQYDFFSYVYLVNGSIEPQKLEVLCQYRVPDKQIIKISIRPDSRIIEIIRKSTNLRGLDFGTGAENFSQKSFDILNRGLNIKDTLLFSKLAMERGAQLSLNLATSFNIYDEREIDENLKWIGNNLRSPLVRFWDAIEYEWPDEEVAKKLGSYRIEPGNGSKSFFALDNVVKTNGDMRISRKIVDTLRSMGFMVISRFDEIERHNNIMKKDK
jgi:hypothetical protein